MRRRDFLAGAVCLAIGALLLLPPPGQAIAAQTTPKQRIVLVWSEGSAPKDIYPNDINTAVAEGLKNLPGWTVKTASLSDPEQGLSDSALENTDVLVWWGHVHHNDIPDATVEKIVRRVNENGMGFVSLHSAHQAKPFRQLLGGVTGNWAGGAINDGQPNRVTVAAPTHPIARGIQDFTIPKEERYEGALDAPAPDKLVLSGVYAGTGGDGPQGMAWNIGKGRVFYFRPGHETYPVYFQPEVRRVLRNAVLWAGHDEAGIWEDNDPAAGAARSAGEPPLSLILRDAGYGGTNVTRVGEADARRFVAANETQPVKITILAAYGVLKEVQVGWYQPEPNKALEPTRRTRLLTIPAANNKQMHPPLAKGAKTTFAPGKAPFGLWVASTNFPGETIYTEDMLQSFVPRFGSQHHKAHVYPAIRSDNTPLANAFILGFEYSTNDDNQEVVLLIENVRHA